MIPTAPRELTQEHQECSQSETESGSGLLQGSTCLPCLPSSGARGSLAAAYVSTHQRVADGKLSADSTLQTGLSGGALNSYITPPFTHSHHTITDDSRRGRPTTTTAASPHPPSPHDHFSSVLHLSLFFLPPSSFNFIIRALAAVRDAG